MVISAGNDRLCIVAALVNASTARHALFVLMMMFVVADARRAIIAGVDGPASKDSLRRRLLTAADRSLHSLCSISAICHITATKMGAVTLTLRVRSEDILSTKCAMETHRTRSATDHLKQTGQSLKFEPIDS